MNKMTIGFFGDSYCASFTNPFGLTARYETYIQQLEKHYNAKITHMGVSGSSIWDLYLLQLKPLIDRNEVPDVCIFVWTSPGRIFNRKYRNINHASAEFWKIEPTSFFNLDKRIWIAAKQFYKFLFDREKEHLEHIALLHYIDTIVLPKLTKSKIIHLWSFADVENTFKPSNIKYPYTWQHGVEIRPPLVSVSEFTNANNPKNVLYDIRPNHLEGALKNQIVFNWVSHAIDNYPSNGQDYSEDINKLWEEHINVKN